MRNHNQIHILGAPHKAHIRFLRKLSDIIRILSAPYGLKNIIFQLSCVLFCNSQLGGG